MSPRRRLHVKEANTMLASHRNNSDRALQFRHSCLTKIVIMNLFLVAKVLLRNSTVTLFNIGRT